jgi:hypothetical protein
MPVSKQARYYPTLVVSQFRSMELRLNGCTWRHSPLGPNLGRSQCIEVLVLASHLFDSSANSAGSNLDVCG